ncbi:nicotinate-nucleotide adenylyltransferase [Robiginitalea sp. M366]|uniref:nicotinate-nucleotide adenylyltransferase n=1 Tax=Robiginitalea aestuariiviva TaxID=3036903 RepID=UPI00240CE63C|nr:nicotinate-nucleotide adenylyltransferase [Robiginitalea aestuariiviva]MDG1572032.1 nicotinate-nucleotide adenylyltransferase [Robiginitalea aestuariiviva]
MKKLLLGLLCIGLTTPALAQIVKTEKLSEVTVYATNYKYLSSVANEEPAAIPVKMLERKVAAFDLENSEFYEDDYNYYQIRFYIPEGSILAAYDKDGNIIRTIERFDNIALPNSVRLAVVDRFPGWEITKDVYRVNYHQNKGAVKTYKLTLENGDKRLRVKIDDRGNFL